MAGNLSETGRWFLITTVELTILFLVLSFLVGLLQAWLPEKKVRRAFDRHGRWGHVVGAALGAVTPFCSYSTIPVLAGLLRSGAPFGPTMSFLFASPLLDPIVLGVLVFVIGLKGTVVYATVTFLASIGIGASLAGLGFESDVRREAVSVCKSGGAPSNAPVLLRVWREAWGFFIPVVPYLLLGTAFGALIYGFVPTVWILAFAGPGQPFAIPLAAALGIPMYVNAETFFPIAGALLDKGMGEGAVVALVVTSMGVSVPEIVLLSSLFRLRLVITIIASVFVVAIGSGVLFTLTVS